jgi:hypothetical protein
MNFSAHIDMPALRKAAARYHRRRLRQEARQRLRRGLMRPFARIRTTLTKWGWRRIMRTDETVRAAENREIAANADQIERLTAAAIIGSLAAYAQLAYLAGDRVGRAKRTAAMNAFIRVQERTSTKE